MDKKLLVVAVTIGISYILSLIATQIIIRLSHKKGWYDNLSDRKIHKGKIPRIGGLAIYLSFVLSASLAYPVVSFILGVQISPFNNLISNALVGLGASVIFFTGLYDDFKGMRARVKLLLQIAAAIIACFGGAVINKVTIPFTSIVINVGYFGWLITVVWIIGIMNAINLIDGMDGLAGTICCMAAFVMGFKYIMAGLFVGSTISFALMGAIFGFLFFNFPKATIFMGDSGALFLGYFLAVMPLSVTPESTTPLLTPATVLAIPIMDVIATIIRRKRDQIPFFEPDSEHMHHKLLKIGHTERQILSIVCVYSIIFGMCTLIYDAIKPVIGNLMILSCWIATIIFFTWLHIQNKKTKKTGELSSKEKK